MKPALLADILRDPTAVAERCVGLRDALPFANVSRLVAGQPELLLQVCMCSLRVHILLTPFDDRFASIQQLLSRPIHKISRLVWAVRRPCLKTEPLVLACCL